MSYNYPPGPLPSYAYGTQALPKANLLEAPSFNAKSWKGDLTEHIDFHPWNIESRGSGNGFQLEKTPMGSRCGRYPDELAGCQMWCAATSYGWCIRSQIVDLVQKGVAAHALDNERPPICVYEWFISRADYPGEFFFEATLLDQSKRKISGFQQQSSKTASSDRWEKVEKIFVDYPPGVRFVKFRDGGKVSLFSAGHCGAKMVGAYVGFHQTRPGDVSHHYPGSPQPGFHPPPPVYHPLPAGLYLTALPTGNQIPLPPLHNLIENPNLRPKANIWHGNSCNNDVELFPWEIIQRDGDGIRLERTPEGVPVGKSLYFHLSSTKNWFVSRADCEGLFYLNVTLLDEQKREILGQSFISGERSPPSDRWEKVEHRFTNYPPGVRYIEFEDGGKDTKFWQGFFGAKMTGASVFVGF